jgi:hypothetical protein
MPSKFSKNLFFCGLKRLLCDKYDKKSLIIVVYLTSFTRLFKMAHACQKRPNLHTNELNTTFFGSTSPLKAPNRLKSLKLA